MRYLYSTRTAYVLIIATVIQVIADDVFSRTPPAQTHVSGTTSEVDEGRKTVSGSTRITTESTAGPLPTSPLTDISATSTIVTPPLPCDNDSFETIRNYGKVYVDKTETLKYLLDEGTKLFFFTRPRRFGKSLFAKMMISFFRGQEQYFNGLKIFDRGGNIVHNMKVTHDKNVRDEIVHETRKPWITYPVIHLDFGEMTMFTVNGTATEKVGQFQTELNGLLKDIAEEYHVDNVRPDFGLPTLIRGLHRKSNLPVIIIIDEYDAPVNMAIHWEWGTDVATGIARILNALFVQIKSNTKYLRFVWVTGVTKLGLTALESGPNSFTDVTLTKELASAVGFTEDEMTSYFKPHIAVLSNAYETTEIKMMKELKRMYDGYRFSIYCDVKVLNPISVLNSFRYEKLDSYWRNTASLSYIIQRISREQYTLSSFKAVRISREFIFRQRDPILSRIPLEVFMLLTGYLTITNYDRRADVCTLDYANVETEETICTGLRNYVPSEDRSLDKIPWLGSSLKQAMSGAKIPEAVQILNRIGFPNYYGPLNTPANEREVTRRLNTVLASAGVLYEDTYQFFSKDGPFGRRVEGDIDITTRNLEINYAIEVKFGIGKEATVLKGIEQQIRYATKIEKRTSFIEVLQSQGRLYLLTLHFSEPYGGRIDEWIFLPFFGGRLRLDKLEASSEDLVCRVRNKVSEMKIDKNCIEDF